MAGYTIMNLREIEDSAPRFGHGDRLEARFATGPLGCEQSGLSYQRLKPNAKSPFGHRHNEEEELYVLVGGSGRVKLDDEIVELKQWDVVRVGSNVTRAFEAGPEGAEMIVFGAPGTGVQDVEMAADFWSD